jgi:DeoR/GlpR family transcriptional regulator of sugar metabolism
VTLIVTGGEWNANLRHLTGSSALETLRRHRADWAFLGACAVHVTAGITATYQPDAEVKRAMIASSDRTVLLADHTKLGAITPHSVAGLEAIFAVVTDAQTGTDALEAAGANLIVADALD